MNRRRFVQYSAGAALPVMSSGAETRNADEIKGCRLFRRSGALFRFVQRRRSATPELYV